MATQTNDAKGAKLEGQWIKVLEARHYGDGVHIGPTDLDAIVQNYRSRDEDAPVGIGPNSRSAKVLGSIGDLRRNGNTLEAKVARVSPSLDNLYQENSGFPKAAVAIKRTGLGSPSLRRVGFLREDGSWPNTKDIERKAPSVDAFGNTEVQFSENSQASRAVRRLKASGHWHPLCDKCGIPQLFEAVQSNDKTIQFGEGESSTTTTMLGTLINLVKLVVPSVRVAYADADLDADARRIWRNSGVTYSEALNRAQEQRAREKEMIEFSEGVFSSAPGAALHVEARRVSSERGCSYGDALDVVARERPDLCGR